VGFGVVEQPHGDRVAGGLRDGGHGPHCAARGCVANPALRSIHPQATSPSRVVPGSGASGENSLFAGLGLAEPKQGFLEPWIIGPQILKELIDDRRQEVLHGSALGERLGQLQGGVGPQWDADDQLLDLLGWGRCHPARFLRSDVHLRYYVSMNQSGCLSGAS